ncbi:MAG: DUF1653 domain-containing protein [Nanoarchaeota archaeon]|nr:DUF1653 domain-containing protein [Nanoarchaeota archaeon]
MESIHAQGIYKHYKGNYYIVLGIGTHFETGEELVVYTPLKDRNKIWVRPLKMFLEVVNMDGVFVNRFTYARQAL